MKICANFKVTKMLILATSFQFCGDLSLLLPKPWGLTPRPLYPKWLISNFWRVFKITLEALRIDAKTICKQFEKTKENCKINVSFYTQWMSSPRCLQAHAWLYSCPPFWKSLKSMSCLHKTRSLGWWKQCKMFYF